MFKRHRASITAKDILAGVGVVYLAALTVSGAVIGFMASKKPASKRTVNVKTA